MFVSFFLSSSWCRRSVSITVPNNIDRHASVWHRIARDKKGSEMLFQMLGWYQNIFAACSHHIKLNLVDLKLLKKCWFCFTVTTIFCSLLSVISQFLLKLFWISEMYTEHTPENKKTRKKKIIFVLYEDNVHFSFSSSPFLLYSWVIVVKKKHVLQIKV